MRRQRKGPVRVIEKIRRNAYRVEVPAGMNMRIQDVITAQQLEQMPYGGDLYQRQFPRQQQDVRHRDAEGFLQAFDFRLHRVAEGRPQAIRAAGIPSQIARSTTFA
jgi:hypothetical protein